MLAYARVSSAIRFPGGEEPMKSIALWTAALALVGAASTGFAPIP